MGFLTKESKGLQSTSTTIHQAVPGSCWRWCHRCQIDIRPHEYQSVCPFDRLTLLEYYSGSTGYTLELLRIYVALCSMISISRPHPVPRQNFYGEGLL